MPMSDARTSHEGLSYDVDHLIFEYLIHNATSALVDYFRLKTQARQEPLNIAGAKRSDIEEHMSMVDGIFSNRTGTIQNNPANIQSISGFQRYYMYRYARHLPQPTLEFRLELLKYIALYLAREQYQAYKILDSSLKNLRQKNHLRAEKWRQQNAKDFSESELLGMHPKRVGIDAGAGTGSFRSNSGFPTLLDLVPVFVRLTALRSKVADVYECSSSEVGPDCRARERSGSAGVSEQSSQTSPDRWSPSRNWIVLASDMMFHAAVEQLVKLDARDYSPVLEAFAWGSELGETTLQQDDSELHALFDFDDEVEVNNPSPVKASSSVNASFHEMKLQRMNELFEAQDLEKLLSKWPTQNFEGRMLGFVEALWGEMTPPFLAQLEGDGDVEIQGLVLSYKDAQRLRSIASK